ncbi:hypothetical protein BBJ28_00006548 [Nothophytophthora sp. Chile5]|nr:hypothetical protein BBJ28_00006548 [Nothophytophthora sp. Chile5]
MLSVNATPPRAYRRPTLLLLGDSLTEQGTDPSLGGWISLLQHSYTRSADVVVRGLYGYNTECFVRHALPGLTRDLASWPESPAFVTLWLGANDAALLSGPEAALNVPLTRYRTNLREIVGAIRVEAPDAAILLITPPAVTDQKRLALTPNGELDFSNTGAAEYASACVEEAAALEVPALNLHHIFNALGPHDCASCLSDGLHLTTKGNTLVADKIRETIEREFPALATRLNTWEHPDYLDLIAGCAIKQ